MSLIHIHQCIRTRCGRFLQHASRIIFVVLMYASGLAGCGDTSNVSPPPAGPGPLSIATQSPLPSGTVNQPYATVVGGSGGTTPYTWSLASGSPALPAGLSLNATTGAIVGTPTALETTTPIFRLQDAASPATCRTKTLDDLDLNHPADTFDYNCLASEGCCQSTLPKHNVGSNRRYPALYVVGEPCVAERIAIQCRLIRHDQWHSPDWSGRHHEPYLHRD